MAKGSLTPRFIEIKLSIDERCQRAKRDGLACRAVQFSVRQSNKSPKALCTLYLLSEFKSHESGAQGRNRTADTAIFSRMLYQLSYLGIGRCAERWRRSGGIRKAFRRVQPRFASGDRVF